MIANKESGWNYSLKEFEPLQYTIYKKVIFMIGILIVIQSPMKNGMIRKLSFTLCLNEDYEAF